MPGWNLRGGGRRVQLSAGKPGVELMDDACEGDFCMENEIGSSCHSTLKPLQSC